MIDPDSVPLVLYEDSRARAIVTSLAADPDMAAVIEDGRRATFGAAQAAPDAFDEYDSYCRHVLVTDPADRPIAGMRLGVGQEIVQPRGHGAFFTAQYWEFHEGMIELARDGVELGRLWVHPDFQRDVWSMALLWKAVAVFHDHLAFGSLFGTVSLVDYPTAATLLILDYLRCYHPGGDDLVSPRLGIDGMDSSNYARDHRDVPQKVAFRALVKELKGIAPEHPLPVLLRHYIRLGMTMPGFASDPGDPSKVMILIVMQSDAMARHKDRFKSI